MFILQHKFMCLFDMSKTEHHILLSFGCEDQAEKFTKILKNLIIFIETIFHVYNCYIIHHTLYIIILGNT